MRIERIVKEESIQHELTTYNGLLGNSGELGCTLLIEYSDEKQRDQMLCELLNLPKHLYVESKDGTKSYAEFDKSQVGDKKVSSVQFLKFRCKANPIKIGSDHAKMDIVMNLSEAQIQTFKEDLV